MGTSSKGKTPAISGDLANANVTSYGPPSQVKGPVLGPGDAGFVSVDDYEAQVMCTDGDPVDVFSGAVVDEASDLVLPGLIPCEVARRYNSTHAGERTLLGVGGWSFTFEQYVVQDARGLKLRGEDGRTARLPLVAVGETVFRRAGQLQIERPTERTFQVYALGTKQRREFVPDEDALRSETFVPAWLRRIVDSRGNSIQFVRERGVLQRIVDTAGRLIVLLHDVKGRVVRMEVQVEGKALQHIDFAYHESGELARVSDALGHSERFAYDGKHRLVQSTLKNGVSFYYRYDEESGECVKTWGDGGLHRYEFSRRKGPEGVLVTTTGANEPSVRLFSPAGDLLRQSTFAEDWVETQEFDADHNLLGVTNAAGEQERFEYDERGHRSLEVDAAGNETRFDYDADLLRRATTADGQVTEYQYDAFGEWDGVTYPTRACYSFRRDRLGRLVEVLGPEGTLASYEYDDQHNIVAERDPRGAVWRFAYDKLGRAIARTDPLGGTTRVEYDGLGRATQRWYPDGTGTSTEYDALGNPVRELDRAGAVTERAYSGTGCLAKQVTPDGGVWRFHYDTSERLLEIVNPGAERYGFEYDRAGRRIEERTFDGRRLRYGYDAAARLRRIDQPDGTWREFTYDPLGNVLLDESPHGSQSFERDSLGRLIRATMQEDGAEAVEISVRRDPFGRVVEERQGEALISRAYDVLGRIIERSLPGVGTSHYAYDVAGALRSVRHVASSGAEQEVTVQRDQKGREVLWAFSAGLAALRQSFDAMDRLVEQRADRAAQRGLPAPAAAHRKWSYDARGQAYRIEDARWGATTSTHDRLGQLLHQQLGELHEVFGYKANGSVELVRASKQASPGGSPWDVGQGNLLLRDDEYDYEYDRCHRRRAKIQRATGQRTEYLWDCRDRLREVRLADGRRVRYFYDALGRRVRKESFPAEGSLAALDDSAMTASDGATIGGDGFTQKTTRFLWDQDVLAAELGDTLERGHVHVPGSFVPLLQVEGGEIFVVITDHLGCPRELCGKDGAARWSAVYSAFGNVRGEFVEEQRSRAPPVRSPFRLMGHYQDEETGLSATRFRYWDADTGRWLSADPLGFWGGLNLFGFDGSPSVWSDPLGLGRKRGGGKKKKKCGEVFVRYLSEAEADAMMAANGLVRDVVDGKPTRKCKWISIQGSDRPGTDKRNTHRVEITTTEGTKAMLESKSVNFDDVDGEAAAPDHVIVKDNEPGSFGVGINVIPIFNGRVTGITKTKL